MWRGPGRWYSHSRTVWSSLPVARVCPSGLNATDQTGSVWPVRGSPGAGVGRVGGVPQPHRLVAAGGGQGVPIRAERHRVDEVSVAAQRGRQGGVCSRDQGV
jgi:hypothetical protein